MTPIGTLTWRLPDGSERTADAYRQLNLLGHAEMIELELPQTCGGQAECGTCRVRILSGTLTDARGEEVSLMTKHARRFGAGERLACQARPRGDVVVEVLALIPPDLRDVSEPSDS